MQNLAFSPSLSNSFADILQEVIQGHEAKDSTNLAPKEEKTSQALAPSKEGSKRYFELEENIIGAVLERFAQTQDEIIKTFDELFSRQSLNAITLKRGISAQEHVSSHNGALNFSYISQRSISISMEGIIKNGAQERQVNIEITLQESFIQKLRSSERAKLDSKGVAPSEKLKLIDPLVIDYLGVGTELSDQSFSFDLDSDGTPDQISRLKQGSGFLALDKNQDGIINNGNELFGTKSGNGFADLALHDKNRDGKIDKNDPIYENLRIWTPLKNGDSRLIALGEAGIGALYLNPKKSEKIMQGTWGNTLGIRRQSAAFERLDGSRGKMHHIDFAKLESNKSEQEGALKPYHISTYEKLSTPLQSKEYSVNEKLNAKQLNDLHFNELWLKLERTFMKKESSAYRLLDEAIFSGKLSKLNALYFNEQMLARARSLLR